MDPRASSERPAPLFYGRYARFIRATLRMFSRPYRSEVTRYDEPVVYVCRHLNSHGPFATIKWLPFHVHPMSLHVLCDRQMAIEHLRTYTFSARFGRKPRKHDFAAWLVGSVSARLHQSLGAVPVYRDANAVKTMRAGMKCLTSGEPMIVWPDIKYTSKYDQPCKIYNGFLFLGEMYERKTGKPLRFIPLTLDDKNRVIHEGEAIIVSDYKRDGEEATARLEAALTPAEFAERQSIDA